MNRNCDIVMLSSSRWDDNFSSSALCLAKEFAKHNRVFFVDHPFTIKDYLSPEYKERIKSRRQALLSGKNISRKIPGMPENFSVVTPRLTLPINWLKKGKVYDLLSYYNDKILHSAIHQVIKDYGIKDYILINVFVPYYLQTLPVKYKPSGYVYQTVDDISQESYIAKHGVRLEREAIKKSDFTLATSKELTKLKLRFFDKVFYFPNAADTALFKTAVSGEFERPPELKEVNKKVICYTGNIGTRINYELLKEVAAIHADKLLVLIGPITTDDFNKSGLETLHNVKYIGSKSIEQLPAYLRFADCTIIPFEYSLLTKSIYPLKINEYLAAGKPVISTAFSEDIQEFNDVAYIAKTNKQFIDSITLALAEDSESKRDDRIKKAESNTWKARVESFWKIVESN